MKLIILITTGLLLSLDICAQTLYVPNGTVGATPNGNTNVGIGTNTPLEKLHINGNIRGNGPGGSLVTKSDYGYIQIGSTNGAFAHFITDLAKYYFNKPLFADGGFSSYGTQDLSLQTNATARITIQNTTGNVGVGTTTPFNTFEVANVTGVPTIALKGQSDAKFHFEASDGSDRITLWSHTDPNSANDVLHFNLATYADVLALKGNGHVGIGTGNPVNGQFEIKGMYDNPLMYVRQEKNNGGTGDLIFFRDDRAYAGPNTGTTFKIESWRGSGQNGGTLVNFTTIDDGVRTSRFVIDNNTGNIGIGTDDTKGNKLGVNGTIIANEVTVKVYPWSDYVFADDYKLPSLSETELFIKEHKHLPDVPSAAEVEANGVKVGEMEAILLKKIEELTLYVIELKKENDSLKEMISEIDSLKRDVTDLKKRIN